LFFFFFVRVARFLFSFFFGSKQPGHTHTHTHTFFIKNKIESSSLNQMDRIWLSKKKTKKQDGLQVFRTFCVFLLFFLVLTSKNLFI
jgi:hypothetical protein